ncbi:MAG: hypothetical protein J1F42_10860 [Lachnospiraceae bacterium]|nr:hypothetical protein [Lachnospiraceae bacterium]
MKWGYITGNGKPPFPLYLDINTHCHALLTGGSNSGKSYTLLNLVGNLLQSNPQIILTLCDFKNSEDFGFLKGYPNYYSGNGCYQGIMNYYESFCNARIQGENGVRHLLIVDEYPAMINYLTAKDKQDKTKKTGDILGAVAEILMLGRGIKYGVWIVTQRADASLFTNGARDNFMIVLGLGRMSKEQKSMLFSGEDVPEKVYRQGEGCLLADGNPLYEVTFPRISNIIDWKKHIKEILMQHYDK